jgi:two-component system response regulator AtoC
MTTKPKVLAVDDNEDILKLLNTTLAEAGYETKCLNNGVEALSLIDSEKFDVVLLDLMMPCINGIEILRKIKKDHPSLQVIMISGFGELSHVVEAVKAGAFDYVKKPFNVDEVVSLIDKAFDQIKIIERRYSGKTEEEVHGSHYYGINKKVKDVLEIIDRVAPTDSTVLVCGETGTGKELIAKALHAKSLRKDKNFVILNCAALQESLIESELFGHEKGAFTGAVKEKKGLVEIADKGTLFLDEIGELGPMLQTKLLRLLEQGEFRRVGSTETRRTNIRVISATNRNLPMEIEKEKFRKDLYYRLNIVSIEPPPLRERKEDMQYLLYIFINKFNKLFNKNIKKVSTDCLKIFENYDWPGNIREFENVIQSSILMTRNEVIETNDLPSKFLEFKKLDRKEVLRPLADIEKDYILAVLKQNDGNKLKTSRILDIDRTTLYKKLREYGIE